MKDFSLHPVGVVISAAIKAASVIAALSLALIPASAGAADSGVHGSIKFDGPRPVRKPIENMKDRMTTGGITRPSECNALHKDHPLLTEDEIVGEHGELANVFVYASSGIEKKDYALPPEPATLDQKGCDYFPHVQGVRVGQTLRVVNSDPTMHNIRSYSKNNPPFNLGQPTQGSVREKIFRKAENALPVKCDVHQWMHAYIFAMDHPFFATSGEDGKFQIKGLAAGKYTLTAWHEVYGELQKEITVTDAGEVQADFTFHPKAK